MLAPPGILNLTFTQPRTKYMPRGDIIHSVLGSPTPVISGKKMLHRLPTKQSDGSNTTTEIPSFQICLGLWQMDKKVNLIRAKTSRHCDSWMEKGV